MDKHILKTLELDKIREMTAERASTLWGKELAGELLPTEDFAAVAELLDLTQEAYDISAANFPPMGGIYDIRPFIKRAQMGASLETKNFADILSTMTGERCIKKFFKELNMDAPKLKARAATLEILGQLERDLDMAVDEYGKLRDDASVELKRIRGQLRAKERAVKEKMTDILHDGENQKYFQESIVTIRDGRSCVPVKSEYKSYFGGIVHDRSATGATLFIEPMPLVELNNDVKQLMLDEAQETARILRLLSAKIAKNADILLENARLTADIDLIFAKAKLAKDMAATRPIINNEGRINIKAARHPLLDAGKVVPIDIALGENYTVLLITGPNTGGKTVSMKTLGLLTLMAQAGYFIPAAADSSVAVCRNIWADIGDEQSIEQSLSTFSSHMKNIVDILTKSARGDLLLLDEIGAGTDPAEGAALSMAILEKLLAAKINVVATTHYSELKTFAYRYDGIENASVEFDAVTLEPVYRLLMGVPGASNAFAVSRRLGLSAEITDRAQTFLKDDHAEFERIINELNNEKQSYREKNLAIGAELAKAKAVGEQAEKELHRLNEEKGNIIRKAKEKAAALIRSANRDAEDIIKELKAQFDDQGIKKRQQTITEARKRLNDDLDKLTDDIMTKKIGKRIDTGKIAVGDTVYVTKLDQQGEVISAKNNTLDVQVGALKITVKAAECRFIKSASATKPKPRAAVNAAAGSMLKKAANISREIDIRGLMVNEAESVLGKFIDDAVVGGLGQIVIIHGKGTGALRKGIHEYLKSHRNVLSYNLADIDEGGAGATVVELK